MTSSPPASLAFLIGRQILDGATTEWLVQEHGLCTSAIDLAWLECRERLSQHFAEQDNSPYQLLTDSELKPRVFDSIRLMLDWRAEALRRERLGAAPDQEEPDSAPPSDTEE